MAVSLQRDVAAFANSMVGTLLPAPTCGASILPEFVGNYSLLLFWKEKPPKSWKHPHTSTFQAALPRFFVSLTIIGLLWSILVDDPEGTQLHYLL